MIAERIQPNVAIVTDVTHCTQTPMMNKIEQGDVAAGKGPGVTYGPAVQNNLLQRIIDTAEDKKIPLQRMAASRFTGTDTDAFAYSNMGVASALISLPLRYMHTTVEMVHKQDVEDCIRLIYETLQNIKVGEDFKYLDGNLVRPAAGAGGRRAAWAAGPPRWGDPQRAPGLRGRAWRSA